MKRSVSLICTAFILIAFCRKVTAQSADFSRNVDTLYLEKGKKAVRTLEIKCTGCNEGDIVLAGLKKESSSVLPSNSFKLQELPDTLRLNSKGAIPVHIQVDLQNESDYGKPITLRLVNHKRPELDPKYYHLFIMRPAIEADSSQYRLMIGTNFDFIDLIQPKSVYYHLQVFTPSAFSKRFGFIGGIQQNRQVSQRDTDFSIYLKNRDKHYVDSVRFNAYSEVGPDSFKIQRLDSVNFRQISTSTVFQIYYEPTFKIYKAKSPKAPTEIFAFIHADISYRRTKFEESFHYKFRDSIVVNRSSFSKYAVVGNATTTTTLDNFEFYYGAGAMIHHENKYIDLYAKFMYGVATLARKVNKGYYAAELGIRIPSINVMFGSEYRGLSAKHDPTYLNVYLSKVVSLNKLFDFLLK